MRLGTGRKAKRRERVVAATNSTPWAVQDAIDALKSGATSLDLPPKELDGRDSLGRRTGQPVAQLGPISFDLVE
jgi:hypothetical protein